MITIMDSDRFIDSIRLLTCKYRIMNSTPEWLSNFCTSGGLSSLSSCSMDSLSAVPTSPLTTVCLPVCLSLYSALLCSSHRHLCLGREHGQPIGQRSHGGDRCGCVAPAYLFFVSDKQRSRYCHSPSVSLSPLLRSHRKHIMQTDGLNVAIATRGLLSAVPPHSCN
jgi:hypothetical protein